jgi:hypothetical protein
MVSSEPSHATVVGPTLGPCTSCLCWEWTHQRLQHLALAARPDRSVGEAGE